MHVQSSQQGSPHLIGRMRLSPEHQRVSALFALLLVTSLALPSSANGADGPFVWPDPLEARDSLSIGEEHSVDAQACLTGICWQPASFVVKCQAYENGAGDALVTFPSPVRTGVASNDVAVLEWFVARDLEDRPVRARAVVVVHESGSRMTVGRLIARNLRAQGLHAFLLHLPYYGERRHAGRKPDGAKLMPAIRQAIADVRRARDAVAVLPLVDDGHIALQGTSLGGIISATTAGLDHGYDSVNLMLAGGDLYDLLQNGQRDAAKFREELNRAGVTDDQLRMAADAVEPTRIAHRVDPERVWLYTADYDQVVPAANSDRLATTMRIHPSHQIHLAADHYTGVVYLPFLLKELATRVKSSPARRSE